VTFGVSPFVRAAERGETRPIELLESATTNGLDTLTAAADAAPRDWARYGRQAAEFHVRNATAWANDRAGTDLTTQIDPDFVLGPALMGETACL
jgi:CO dehydrogenase maturation factor